MALPGICQIRGALTGFENLLLCNLSRLFVTAKQRSVFCPLVGVHLRAHRPGRRAAGVDSFEALPQLRFRSDSETSRRRTHLLRFSSRLVFWLCGQVGWLRRSRVQNLLPPYLFWPTTKNGLFRAINITVLVLVCPLKT